MNGEAEEAAGSRGGHVLGTRVARLAGECEPLSLRTPKTVNVRR